ncbi:MAG: DUF4386 family protein [Bacteroidota bacterium]|nr:DUF4386 family protein [Bacteroidota bacterium]
MIMTYQQNEDRSINIDPSYKKVYRLGGLTSLILIIYSLITILIVSFIGGPPVTIEECFYMLNENKLHGLLRLDILTVFIIPLYYLLFYSIYLALRKKNKGLMTVSIILVFAGVTLFLATPSVFSYLHLSNKYAVATTDIQRNQLLAAGNAILASDMWHGTGALIGGLLMQTGALLISFVMLKDNTFNRLTSYTGIVTHGLDLAHIVIGFVLPSVGVILMAVAGPIYLLWFPLIGARLFKLSRK